MSLKRALAAALLAIAGVAAAWAQAWAQTERPARPGSPPALATNEADIAELLRPGALAIDDPLAVFAFVLGSLPERVQVYPTENYYYFRFIHGGVPYTGNIRLAASDRDDGKVHFAYNEAPSDWRPRPDVRYQVLDATKNVTVEKLAPLAYRVSHGGKAVSFALNDLSQVKPPADLLGPNEAFLGPIFDESGIRFFFIFHTKLKIFHYLLDDTGIVSDQWAPSTVTDRIKIGKRTGFAFYQDGRRSILIGVNDRNSRLNTPYDGPFDQLPENFMAGDTLRDAILAADPTVKGQIDRLGNFADDSGRYLIHPYRLYRSERDLAVFHRCATSRRVPAADRPRCFVMTDDEQHKPNPLPLALKPR